MTKTLDNDELKKVTGAGQDPNARDIDRLEADHDGSGGSGDGGEQPEPVDIQSPGLRHIQEG